jgi:hypothetical protein
MRDPAGELLATAIANINTNKAVVVVASELVVINAETIDYIYLGCPDIVCIRYTTRAWSHKGRSYYGYSKQKTGDPTLSRAQVQPTVPHEPFHTPSLLTYRTYVR